MRRGWRCVSGSDLCNGRSSRGYTTGLTSPTFRAYPTRRKRSSVDHTGCMVAVSRKKALRSNTQTQAQNHELSTDLRNVPRVNTSEPCNRNILHNSNPRNAKLFLILCKRNPLHLRNFHCLILLAEFLSIDQRFSAQAHFREASIDNIHGRKFRDNWIWSCHITRAPHLRR